MSLFGGKKRTVRPDYTGLQVQTASSALPIPIIYGTNRIAPNVIWSDGFQNHAQRGKKAGGKGGGRHGVTGYAYSTWIMFGLAEGPVQGIGEVFSGQSVTPFPTNFLSLIPGDTPQQPRGPALARYPAAALPYNGTAYLASPDFDLGSSATISSIAFEVVGRLAGTAGPLGQDADPAALISEFLTNAQYGVGLPASALSGMSLFGASGDASYQTYRAALGLGLSPSLTDAETANSILARWLRLTNSAAVWSGARLRIVPYGDQVVTGVTHTGASVTHVPDVAPVYDLTDDDVLAAEGDDPVRLAHSDPYGLPNVQRVECSDRSHGYTATTVEARDQGAIERYGLKVGGTITAREICALSIGRLVAQLALQRALYIRNTFTFRLSWAFCLLEPMGVVSLTDPGLGLARAPVRVTAIEEDEDGLLTVTAEELPRGTAAAYPRVGATGSAINRDRAPAPVNDPLLFEPPAALTAGVAQVWIAASGANADPYWGGANVWVSRDGASFVEIGTITDTTNWRLVVHDGVTPGGHPAVSAGDLKAGVPVLGMKTAADANNRLAVKSEAALLSWDDVTPGAGNMRLTLNKKAAANDAGFVLQTGYASRVLFGTLGSDDLIVKTSPDGAAFRTAMTVSAGTGDVGLAGVTEPGAPLHVQGSGAQPIVQVRPTGAMRPENADPSPAAAPEPHGARRVRRRRSRPPTGSSACSAPASTRAGPTRPTPSRSWAWRRRISRRQRRAPPQTPHSAPPAPPRGAFSCSVSDQNF
ncbi:MAG: phage tail protein [Microvirga sp.]